MLLCVNIRQVLFWREGGLQALQGGDTSNQAAPPAARHTPVAAPLAARSLVQLLHADIAPVTVPYPNPRPPSPVPTSLRHQVLCFPSMFARSTPRSPTRCWRSV